MIIMKKKNRNIEKCEFLSSGICICISSEGEILTDEENLLKMVKLNCGHIFHHECLKIITNSNIENIQPGIEIRCPKCFINSKVIC